MNMYKRKRKQNSHKGKQTDVIVFLAGIGLKKTNQCSLENKLTFSNSFSL